MQKTREIADLTFQRIKRTKKTNEDYNNLQQKEYFQTFSSM